MTYLFFNDINIKIYDDKEIIMMEYEKKYLDIH